MKTRRASPPPDSSPKGGDFGCRPVFHLSRPASCRAFLFQETCQMAMYSTYLRLGVSTNDSWRTVVRASARKLAALTVDGIWHVGGVYLDAAGGTRPAVGLLPQPSVRFAERHRPIGFLASRCRRRAAVRASLSAILWTQASLAMARRPTISSGSRSMARRARIWRHWKCSSR